MVCRDEYRWHPLHRHELTHMPGVAPSCCKLALVHHYLAHPLRDSPSKQMLAAIVCRQLAILVMNQLGAKCQAKLRTLIRVDEQQMHQEIPGSALAIEPHLRG